MAALKSETRLYEMGNHAGLPLQFTTILQSPFDFALLFTRGVGYDRCMKRVGSIIAVIFLVCLASCLNWFLENPIFVLKEVTVIWLSLADMSFLFGVEVQNLNSYDLILRALEYTVYFNDKEVGKGRLEKEAQIAKASSTMVRIPLQADFKSLGDPLALFLAGKNLQYKIEGAAILKARLGTATIPFSKSGEIKINK